VAPVELGTGDNPWLAVGRQPHRLGAIELGVLERGNPDELHHDPCTVDIDLIRQHNVDLVRQRLLRRRWRAAPRRRHLPWLVGVLVVNREADTNKASRHVGLSLKQYGRNIRR